MADKTITFSKSIVAQKDISDGNEEAYITQLSKPIILRGISTKTCQNVLYSIDGMNFTDETTIGNNNVLSMAIVPFQLGGAEIDSEASVSISKSIIVNAFSYILGGRYINEDINIERPISKVTSSSDANGAYRYLLRYLSENKDKIEWDTGDLFLSLDADHQDSFGGSDFITDAISVNFVGNLQHHELSIAKQTDANGSILKPAITLGEQYANVIIIKQSPYFFLYGSCPASDKTDKLIIDNFWRGGGLLISRFDYHRKKGILILYIFAVA